MIEKTLALTLIILTVLLAVGCIDTIPEPAESNEDIEFKKYSGNSDDSYGRIFTTHCYVIDEDESLVKEMVGKELFDAAQENVVHINGEAYSFVLNGVARYEMTDGGPADTHFYLRFEDPENSRICVIFRLENRGSARAPFLSSTHTNMSLHVSSNLDGHGLGTILPKDTADIVLTDGIILSHSEDEYEYLDMYIGKGYIVIKEDYDYECPEKMWVGGEYVYKGDEDYVCYHEGYFIPKQVIPFNSTYPEDIIQKCCNGLPKNPWLPAC
ncbi:MAG TPA: hypothetical protein C5S51_08445 [Methanosarcinaceae archaeon]|nr:hypothetical protein [Methanosarcinaceae archaeon]